MASSQAVWLPALSLAFTGDVEKARLHASEAVASAERVREPFSWGSALWASAFMYTLEGQWQNARDFSNDALVVLPLDPRALGTRVGLEYQVGDFDQGEAYLQRLMGSMRLSPRGATVSFAVGALVMSSIAHITGVMDHLEAASAAAHSVISSEAATPMVEWMAKMGLGLMAVVQSDEGVAQARYAALVPYTGTMATIGTITTDRLLGLLSHTMDNLDQATSHFEDSLAFCRKAGYRPELSWTCCDYADTLRERDGDGDRAKAMSLLDESLAISSELGMRPLMERVLSRREILRA